MLFKEEYHMKELKNKVELAQLVELYKTGKVTKTALELELGKSVSELVTPNTLTVAIISEVDGNTNSTFGVTSLPEMVGEKILVTLLVDKDAIMNFVETKEIIEMIAVEASRHQKVLKEYSKFIKEHKDSEVLLEDALAFFLELYEESLEELFDELPEISAKLIANRTIQSVKSIKAEKEAIKNPSEDLRLIVERLTISKKFPLAFITASRKLVSASVKNEDPEQKLPLFYTDEKPVMNQFHQQRRALSDGTYTAEKMSKVIAHDYKPDTNLQ
jgi:hypothetical protein